MPKIYRTYNNLKSELIKTTLLIGSLWFASLILIIFLEGFGILKYFGIFIVIISSLLTSILSKDMKTIMSGINGENKALKMIEKIPKEYTVFSNLNIKFEDNMSETDLIVVGKKGVFLLEIKNHTGIISGNDNDHNWRQFKVTDNGGKYTNQFYNPIKQVGTQVFRLSNILKESGFNGWVQGVVMFANPECTLKAKTKKMPLLNFDTSISSFLDSYKPKKELTEDEIKLITYKLKKIASNNNLQHKQQTTKAPNN